MKRLLITLLVLGMASPASALTASLSFTGELPTGGIVELSIFGATYDPYLAMVIQPPGVLSNFTSIYPPPPGIPPFPQPITISGYSGEVWAFVGPAPEPYVDGVWLTADWSSTVPVWVRAYETFDGGMSWILLDQIQVPEPMTVALLGLGGLFILRRRRHK